ncbi:hypothetical protein CDIK_0525 [Cucumispora dikerogammari]|nr:hypothetical protein CDIK_0525 [Cucumispora dikerogammari]
MPIFNADKTCKPYSETGLCPHLDCKYLHTSLSIKTVKPYQCLKCGALENLLILERCKCYFNRKDENYVFCDTCLENVDFKQEDKNICKNKKHLEFDSFNSYKKYKKPN